MRLGVIVFARLDSRRLPGKALRPLAGRALLGRVLDRMAAVPGTPPVILATSERPVDDPLAAFGMAEGVAVFRGSAEDVAERALACAERFGFDAIVRISGDSPFVDPALVGACVARFREAGDLDLLTNVMPRTFPPGASVEVIAVAALRRALAESDDPEDREHVTRHFYRRPERFRIENRAAMDDRYQGVALTVDWPADLARAERIFDMLGPRAATAPLDEVCAAARAADAERREGAA